MKKYKKTKEEFIGLSKKAEKRLQGRSEDAGDLSKLSPDEIQHTINELRVHQIELEMQNKELRKIQLEIEESRNRYFDLYEFAPVGYLTLNQDLLIVEANRTCAYLLGVERIKLTKKGFSHFINKDYQDKYYSSIRQCFETKERQTCELKLEKNEGTSFYGQLECIAVKGSGGDFDQIRIALTDINDRKLAENALHLQGEIASNMSEGVYLIRASDGVILYTNHTFEEIFGYDPGELVGKHVSIVNYPTEMTPEETVNHIGGILRQTGAWQGEIRNIKKDGTPFWCYASASIFEHPEYGEIIVSVHTDITEHHRIDEALKDSEEKFRLIAETAADYIYQIDLEGIMTYCSPAVERILGYKPQEMIGTNFSNYIPPANLSETIKNFQSLVSSRKTLISELQLVKKDGTIINAETSAASIMKNGEIVGVQGITRDITERKHLQARLQQDQKMKAVGILAGGIAHNFNNLLMGIQGNASITLLNIDSNQPHHKNLKNIEKLVHRGSKLTGQLLGYAREGRYEIRPISLNRLVKETSDTFGAARKEIRLHQELAEDLPGIKADQGQIEQVLLSLYLNAADAMPGGGELFLKTMKVTHENMTGKQFIPRVGNYCLLTVRDTGTGMDRETMERIFDPFFTTKGLAGSTGLGLAAAYGIIKGHDGYIDVHSEKGHGTTFNIYLPAMEKIAVEEEKELFAELLKGKETILFVDDEEIIVETGEQMLQKLGYKVLSATSGQEALELYRKNQDKIAMVFLDMVMPVIGGGETYDRIKEINPKVKVLLFSGYSIDGEAKEILERGCNGFIQKPFNIKEMSQKIREIID